MDKSPKERLTLQLEKKKLSPATLLIGSYPSGIQDFVLYMLKAILCQRKATEPCLRCQACELVHLQEHPDCIILAPEKGRMITIEQVRSLETVFFLTPQLGNKRVILIQAADKMNHFSSNALLKILEEPPSSVHFMLVAEQISTVLPTIVSRCQLWYFPTPFYDDLSLLKAYPADSGWGEIALLTESIIEDLVSVQEGRESIPTIAEKWKAYPLWELISLLYIIHMKLVREHFLGLPASMPLVYSDVRRLFVRVNALQEVLRNIQKAISLNPLLTLESLLLVFYPEELPC